MARASAIPDTIDALIAALRAAVGPSVVAGVQIFDGPPLGDYQPDYICVGWSNGNSSVRANEISPETFDDAGTESFDMPCMIRSWRGEVDIKARRDLAFDLMDALALLVEDLASANPGVSAVSYSARESAEGAEVILDVNVHIEILN